MYCLKPLQGGPARKLQLTENPQDNKATVLYIGRIPHGFYEDEMEGANLFNHFLFLKIYSTVYISYVVFILWTYICVYLCDNL